ncbi:MAG: hypothetical protein GXY49_00960 [Syntrophomonadaceae bacterium]|nr:hypothetical protein [Syntrophomonadaceae bacterium]
MIFYTADPMDLLPEMKANQLHTVSLPSGGLLQLEIIDNQQARVASIVSTDPMDYMHADLQPGRILNISYTPES